MHRHPAIFRLTAGLLLAALLGCQPGADSSVFKSAAPEIKAMWERARVAASADDYVVASTNFTELIRLDISAEQLVEVQNALRNLNQRLNTAAAKGDVAAIKALEQLRAGSAATRTAPR